MVLVGVVPTDVEEKFVSVNQDYLEAVLRAGGTPVLFPAVADPEQISALLDRVDGMLLTGGADVNPAVYGDKKMSCCGETSDRRDAMEVPLCREVLRRRMPFFAICRGMQIFSCVLGGKLYQDLGKQFGTGLRHPRFDTPRDPVHEVNVLPESLLSSITGPGPLPVNSRHHQGISRLGEGFRINARAADGLIEGIELPDYPFALGVQWHPESLSDRYPAHQKLFDDFVKACSASRP